MSDVKTKTDRRAVRPGAPALDKGLDILEALASESEPMSQKAIASRVGRSVNEIFRMLGVLEDRGFIVRDKLTGHYRLTLRLFELAQRHPPTRRLQQAALTTMEQLSEKIGHPSHLVIPYGDRLMVIAQAQPQTLLMGLSVKVGAVFPLVPTFASARVIAAFQPPEHRKEVLQRMQAAGGRQSSRGLEDRLRKIREEGVEHSASDVAPGVTDISAPVLDHFGEAVAALTIPFIAVIESEPFDDNLMEAVRAAAAEISRAIGGLVPPAEF